MVEQNPKEIAEAILKFYQQKRENEFVENVKIEKKKYAWDKMTNAVMKMLG